MVAIEFKELYLKATVRAKQEVITEGEEDGAPLLSETPVYHILFFRNDTV